MSSTQNLYHLVLELATTSSMGDECCLVLNQTPLFMFVKPFAVLLSNVLVCFSVFWYCRSLRWNLGRKSEKGKKEEKYAPCHCARAQEEQSSALCSTAVPTIKCRPSQPASHAVALAGPDSIASSLALEKFSRQLRMIDRTVYDRSHTWLRLSAMPPIERTTLTLQHLIFV